jgi:uncharacterized protein YdeI (YjbR/CyaY-like superfamily)
MSKINPKIDLYYTAGCGRCPLGNTPQCKVNKWPEELEMLRKLVLDSGLTEELKWGVPCFTLKGSNIVILGAFKDYVALSFFKGVLLSDTHNILIKPGENTQAVRLIRFTNVQEIGEKEALIKAYIYEAIEIEKADFKVAFKTNPEPIPDAFQNKLSEFPALKKAFYALTAGQQRGYILHFSAPKQAKTRVSRIEQCLAQILNGKGLNN